MAEKIKLGHTDTINYNQTLLPTTPEQGLFKAYVVLSTPYGRHYLSLFCLICLEVQIIQSAPWSWGKHVKETKILFFPFLRTSLYNQEKFLEILQKSSCVFVYLLAFYVDIWYVFIFKGP